MTAHLPRTMRAQVLSAPGALALAEMPVPLPGPGEVLVRIAASPINPSDQMTVQGAYGIGKPYPLVPGLEGSGEVVAAGPGLMGRLLMGKAVACATGQGGMWAEYAVVPARTCIPLPAGVSLGAGAMSAVNPLTAIALIAQARTGGHRAAISTGAGGQLGRMIRKRGRQKGVKIINVVRRAEQVEALKAEGAPYVVNSSDPDFAAQLREMCRALRCRMAFEAVGGRLTAQLIAAMGPRPHVLIYGALAQEAVPLDPGALIFREARVEGFWLSKWLPRKMLPQMLWYAREATQALKGGFAVSEVARVVPLDRVPEGLAAYEANMSAGKTLIRMAGDDLGVSPVA